MIIILKGADFSANNVGRVDVPYEISEFTKNAIVASGNANMSQSQKIALDVLFSKLGYLNGTGVSTKIKYLWMPILCKDLANAFVDYANGNKKSFELTADDYVLAEGGVRGNKPISSMPYAKKTSDVKIKNFKNVFMCGSFNNFQENVTNFALLGTSGNGRINPYMVHIGDGQTNFSLIMDTGQKVIQDFSISNNINLVGAQSFIINNDRFKFYSATILRDSKILQLPQIEIDRITPIANLSGKANGNDARYTKMLALGESIDEKEMKYIVDSYNEFERLYQLG